MKALVYIFVVSSLLFVTHSTGSEDPKHSRRARVQSILDNVRKSISKSDNLKLQNKKITIMVSSTVYGIEHILDRVYQILTDLGYEVWMSHKGTLPVYSGQSAFDSCISAVKEADLLLCIITPQYGSGRNKSGLSITHKELLHAIKMRKLRWTLAHDHVVFARSLLGNLGFLSKHQRKTLKLKSTAVFGDLKVIDMYEDATLNSQPLSKRQGNWVQKYGSIEDISIYVKSQFGNYARMQKLLSLDQ